MKIALFDLDNTLLLGDSDHAWSEYLVSRGILDEKEFRAKNDQFMLDYQNRTLSIDDFLDFQLEPFKRFSKEQLNEWHGDFMRDIIDNMIVDYAHQLVQRHQEADHLVAIVTATNRFVTAPIAKRFGIDHLIATEMEEKDGQYTGKPSGQPCFQEGKIIKVNDWLVTLDKKLSDFQESYFYSDSANDLPLLNQVTHPVAVNPDSTLKAVAEEKGWPIIYYQKVNG